jgi:hypothetical protein
MGWFGRPRCPVAQDEQAWIDESYTWLLDEFGDSGVPRPIAEPTRAHFPIRVTTGPSDAAAVMHLVAGRMGVRGERIRLEYVDAQSDGRRRWQHAYRGPAGHYHEEGDQAVITVYVDQASSPQVLIATLAHELGHVRLLGERRIDEDRRDGEPLTDLLTVVFGLGIFTANAAFDFTADDRGWRSQRLGYMTEQMYGYALARYSLTCGEDDPGWARYLDTNPREYMRQAVRYLTSTH